MWHFSMVHKWHFSNIIWWEAAIKMSPISSLSRLGICLLFLYQQRFLPKLCLCVSGFQQQYTWTAGNTVWPHTMLSYTTAFGTQFGTFSHNLKENTHILSTPLSVLVCGCKQPQRQTKHMTLPHEEGSPTHAPWRPSCLHCSLAQPWSTWFIPPSF